MIGYIALARKQVQPFTDKQISLCGDFAAQATIALESTRRERQYREMQSELAHANRVATIGHLTASIAHEIKQPIATARNNARAALNFLDKSPPDVADVREALTCIVNDVDRTSDVVDRIGSLVKKAPPRKQVVDLNAAILEVTAVTRSEAIKTGVTVGAQLADELPRIQCDRVQLQQVMLNLIVNAIQSMSGVEDGDVGDVAALKANWRWIIYRDFPGGSAVHRECAGAHPFLIRRSGQRVGFEALQNTL
jgi:C4-dicarboxylate-specific signal transduction histidine kinase